MSILENENVVDWRVETAQDCSYLVDVPAATTLVVSMTMKEKPSAEDTMALITDYHAGINNVPTLTFVDNGGSNDLLQRDKGSWLDLGFRVGQELTIAGGNTNDGTYTILVVTDNTIEVATASFTDEVTNTYTANAAIPDTDYSVLETIAGAASKHVPLEISGTGLRFQRTVGSGTIKVSVRS